MNQEEARELIDKYLQGNATREEKQLVESWYQSMSSSRKLTDEDNFEHLSDELWLRTLQRAQLAKTKKRLLWWPYVAAASICLFILIGKNYLFEKKPALVTAKVLPLSNDILPGGNKAVLILASGKQIILADEKKGAIARENNTIINKTADGQVSYQAANHKAEVIYNTIRTPRGGQYTVVLADGTKVTLNAASSLKFPTSFSGPTREVELVGEGYFEVAHNKNLPFHVISNGQRIEVLGTHFNISCYDDEAVVKTTLLEGSVKVVSGKTEVMLKPGEQSQLMPKDVSHRVVVKTVDIDEAVAWKNGLFEFKEASIQDVMRSAARWYDLDVEYPAKIPGIRISGRMSRNVNFSGLVQLLEFEGIQFKINDKKVKVVEEVKK